jgi:hypothetical protein
VAALDGFDYRAYLRERGAPVGDDFWRWPGDALKGYFSAFQIASSVSFNRWWREELNRAVGRRVPVSCNNGVQRWTDIELAFDYGIGELSTSHAKPEPLYGAMRQAGELGKTQSVTMPLRRTGEQESPDWVRHTRQTIATVYATGGHIEMPWDTYLPTPDAQRYFGKPGNYADLTAFVRGMARYLDGYADAYAGGGELQDTRWLEAPAPVTPLTDAADLFVFARARPDEAAAPVVVHLIDWREQPQPFALSLRPRAFFGNLPLRLRLFTPGLPHDPAAHDEAYRSGNYSGLVRETALGAGFVSTVSLPALAPWGVLVVEPEVAGTPGLWPPAFASSDADFFSEMQVVLDAVDPGAQIHYTLDGSVPGAASPRYTGPVTIDTDRTVAAVSIVAGAVSAVASARFVKRERPPSLIANGEFDAGLDGWQRLVFAEAGDADTALAAGVETSGRLSGRSSVRLVIKQPTGVVYHLRLVHPFAAKPGMEYELSFRAVADGPVRCRVGLQALAPPHKVLGMRQQPIGTVPRRYTLIGRGLQEGDATAYLVQFDVGAAENAGRTLWLDDVRLQEREPQE